MKLRISNGKDAADREVDLPGGGILTIGRASDSDVVIDDASASRHHAHLTLSDGKAFVEDLGSSSGTLLNGRPLAEIAPFGPGDEVRIGRYVLTVSAEGDDEGEAGPATQMTMGPGGSAERNATQMTIAGTHDPGRDIRAAFRGAMLLSTDEMIALKDRIHVRVLELIVPDGGKQDERLLAADAERALDQVLREIAHELPDTVPLSLLRQALLDELIGYGPISPMLRAPEISEVMVNGPDRIFAETGGKLVETGVRFSSEQHLMKVIQRIVEPLGRHVDDASPMVDARLPDGSRVNAIIPPLAIDGASLTIRKFAEKKLTTEDLIRFGSMTREMALFLEVAGELDHLGDRKIHRRGHVHGTGHHHLAHHHHRAPRAHPAAVVLAERDRHLRLTIIHRILLHQQLLQLVELKPVAMHRLL